MRPSSVGVVGFLDSLYFPLLQNNRTKLENRQSQGKPRPHKQDLQNMENGRAPQLPSWKYLGLLKTLRNKSISPKCERQKGLIRKGQGIVQIMKIAMAKQKNIIMDVKDGATQLDELDDYRNWQKLRIDGDISAGAWWRPSQSPRNEWDGQGQKVLPKRTNKTHAEGDKVVEALENTEKQ